MQSLLTFVSGIGNTELGVLLVIGVLPFALTLYSIFDIFRSDFKEANSKLLFLILVLLVPFIGSIIYLLLRHNYKTKATDNNEKMPL